MKKLTLLATLLIVFLGSSFVYAEKYSGGDGSSGTPYKIATLADLNELSTTTDDWVSGKYFIQTAHIDATSTSTLNAGEGFVPIGNSTIKFQGNYDGQNYTVTNLFINRPSTSNIGLFGYASGATIQNVGIVNCNITGLTSVAGLVGITTNSCTINNCFSSGSITGNDAGVGGLIGQNKNSSISNSFSTCNVSGSSDVGGLVGYNSNSTMTISYITYCYSTGNITASAAIAGGFVGTNAGIISINNCYSLGNVTRSAGSSPAFGGFCGMNDEATIDNCYCIGSVSGDSWTDKGFVGSNFSGSYNNNFFDKTTSGQTTGNGATAKITPDMKYPGTFTDWDFSGDAATDWVMSSPISFAGYPTLRWTGGYSLAPTGTPKEIATLPNLVWVAENSTRWADTYTQTANINAWTTPSWDGNKGWTPIGNSTTQFTGVYNGSNYIISNLFINRATDYVGLFGYVAGFSENPKFINIGLVNVNVTGKDFVGGLVGNNAGSKISNSYSIGSVSGSSYVGGFAGGNDGGGTINKSCSTGSVFSSGNIVGGFVGFNLTSTINNCYSLVNVTRTSGTDSFFSSFCGGNNESTIQFSFSTGSVIYNGGTNPTNKGFVGYNVNSTTTNNFYDSETSEQTSGTGATSKTTSEMKTQSTFTDWDFTPSPHDWNIQSGSYISYPYLQGLTYDTPGASPIVNPIPGLEGSPCQSIVNVDASYTSGTPGWGVTHFADLSLALAGVCAGGTVNIANVSNTSYSGDVSFDGLIVVLGDYDFELTGNISAGLIRTTEDGSLVMKNLTPGTAKTFPITDGTYDFTVTINIPTGSNKDISMNIISKQVSKTLTSKFVVIGGDANLNATMTMRVDKSSIAPKTLGSTSNLRYFSSTKNKYVPYDGNKTTIEEFDTYYIITVTGVNEF